MKLNPLQIYKVNVSKIGNIENPSAPYKTRPCIVVQISSTGYYYGSTSYLVVPLSSNYHPDLENYTVELMMVNKKSYALIYNFGITTQNNLLPWKQASTDKNIFTSPEKIKEVIDKTNNMLIIGGRMTLEQFNKKPYFDEVVERIEKINESLEKRIENMELYNKKLQGNNEDLKQDNKELKQGNKELKSMLKEIMTKIS